MLTEEDKQWITHNSEGWLVSARQSAGSGFNITTGGSFTVVDTLSNTTGAYPLAPMVQASNGDFYGTAFLFQYGNGDIYRLGANGTLKAIYWWKGTAIGGTTGLIAASDGNLYGTGGQGYSSACSSIYKISLTDEYTPVYEGCGGGELFETNTLLQGTNGMFYGSYTDGFASAIYSLDTGLSPSSPSFNRAPRSIRPLKFSDRA